MIVWEKLLRFYNDTSSEKARKLKTWFFVKPLQIIVLPTVGFLIRIAQKIDPDLIVYLYRSNRIGHQTGDIDLYLRRRTLDPTFAKEKPILIAPEAANQAVESLVRKKISVFRSRLLVELIDNTSIIGKTIPRLPGHKHPALEFNQTSSSFELPKPILSKGDLFLNSLGLKSTSPFVCIHSRDSSYLKETKKDHDFSYHDYRDFSVTGFSEMAKDLNQKQITIFRMGSIASEKLGFEDSKNIDYANRFHDEELDLYLMAKCLFYIGSTAGIFNLALFFNRPIACINVVPLGEAPSRSTDLFIPKKYFSKKENRHLTFSEIISMKAYSWGQKKLYSNHGIEVHENTPSEIKDLATEMLNRLEKKEIYTKEDDDLQKRYKEIWPKTHPVHHMPSRIGKEFIRENQHLLM